MNCANHPDTTAVSFCRTCGKPLCAACERRVLGVIYCEDHAQVAPQANVAGAPQNPYSPYTSPYTGPQDASASPGLAFLLGLIPGVGAIYNGQYAKGLVHVIIFGFLISIVASESAGGMEPLFGLLSAVWYIYMPFEAYHTARKRVRGEPVDEFSSLVPFRPSPTGLPVTPILLILFGVMFLLHNLEIIRIYQIMRFWPVVLILLGVYLLWARLRPAPSTEIPPSAAEVANER
jgi:TM2 domain-containing membrane protein YozV